MKRSFIKMHGIGNDYIYFDCLEEPIIEPAKVAVRLSDRHFSIGGDGIVLILPSKVADVKMRMFNADGSEGMMCGNAIRCVGKYLYDICGLEKELITVETRAGIKSLMLAETGKKGEALAFCVDMGKPEFAPARIPVLLDGERIVDRPYAVGGNTYRITCVSMGNPHCVTFGEDPDSVDVGRIGPLFENDPIFPQRVNAEFVQPIGKNKLKMRVWERGSGETLACGTGACAAAVAAVENGLCERNADIGVVLRGGTLTVRYTAGGVYLTGPAAFAFRGVVEL